MTEAELLTRLGSYLAAETAILSAQEYVVGQGVTARRLTRADLAAVQQGIKDTRADLARLQATASGVRRIRYIRPLN